MGHTGIGQQQNCAVLVMYDTSAKGFTDLNVSASLETDSNTSVSNHTLTVSCRRYPLNECHPALMNFVLSGAVV